MALAVSESFVIPDGQRLTVMIPWPRFPLVTPHGRLSKAKNAGKLLPWLSANNVNRVKPVVHHQLRGIWRDATREAIEHMDLGQVEHRVTIEVRLHRGPNARTADVGAIVEGVKPILDGAVRAGLIADDSPRWVGGLSAGELVHVKRGQEAVELRLRAA